jgi:glycosyltransferase involved in cell wall biosynthesis
MLTAKFDIPVSAIYGSDFSIAGYRDREFGADFAWDTDLLSGYNSVFLSRTSSGGANDPVKVSSRGLEERLRQLAPKAILVTGYNTRFHQAAFYEAWKGGYPIIFRGETTDHAKVRNFAHSWIRDRILWQVYKRCSRLLYVGQNSYKHFKRLGCPEEKLIFSPYCVDTKAFVLSEDEHIKIRSKVRGDLRIPEDGIVFIFSGKLSRRKRPDLILEAVKKLPREIHSRIVMLFLGDGELRDRLQGLAASEIAAKTIFTGFKNQTELSAYYHAADLLILPSAHSETWGLVVNEALHHGLPCVVSEAVGSAPDLIKQGINGEIFKTDSAESLALAIQRACVLIGRFEVRKMCRESVNNYTVEKAAEGVALAYKEITRGG